MVPIRFSSRQLIPHQLIGLIFTGFHRSHRRFTTNAHDALHCGIDAEPLSRYREGGYHPVHLGDRLKNGRYQISHKLGWGGYSTVWLAKDHELNRPVAVKIMVSEQDFDQQEKSVYRRLAHGPRDHLGQRLIPVLFDDFEIKGPNGVRQCLVLELTGPSVVSVFESHKSNRLPGKLAWATARQVVQAVAYMHRLGIVHGDLHPGNIVFANESMSNKTHEDLLRLMGPTVKGDIKATRGQTLMHHPQYLVLPSSIPRSSTASSDCKIKVVDFGTSFFSGDWPPKMRCPLPYRAPEAVITSDWDAEADIWSLGCTIFALIVGYPPFDSFIYKEKDLVSQWVATFGPLPSEWKNKPMAQNLEPSHIETTDLSQWIHETYFDDGKPAFFSEKDIQAIGEMLKSLLRFRPSERPCAEEILLNPLFREDASKQ